jgi:hypothetical protein
MSDHGTTTHPTTTAPIDPELFLEDRQKFWGGVMNAALAMIIFVVLLLIGMAVFLL